MHTQPGFLQGIFPFEGQGLEKTVPIDESLRYVVPFGTAGQALYFRGGNSSDALVTVVLVRGGVPMRYFPIGAQASTHVALAGGGGLGRRNSSWSCRLAAPEGAPARS